MSNIERHEGHESEAEDLSSDNMGVDPRFTPAEIEVIQSQDDPVASTESPPVNKKKRLADKMRADVWTHFKKGEAKEDGTYRANCIYCPWHCKMGKQKSTSSMHWHVDKGCKSFSKNKRQKPNALQQMLQTGNVRGAPSPVVWVFDQAKCRKSFAKMVIVHEYPFNCVTHYYLRSFLSDLQPQFKLMSRNTLRSDCLKIYEDEKCTLYSILEKLDCRVSLTSDLWTNSVRDRGFMAITCHYIDETWQIRKRIINFSYIPSPHTGKNLADAIFLRLVTWNLDQKIFTLTLDNASSNDACIRELLSFTEFKQKLPVDGAIFHQRCSCHILNLIVQDGLDVMPQTIQKVRDTMKYLRFSQSRLETFTLASSQVNLVTKRKPALDVSTRWNSTYLMLDLALELKSAIIRYAVLDTKYSIKINDEEWVAIEALCGHLKVFYEATLKLSGSQYPTLNLFFPEYSEVFLCTKKMIASDLPFVVEMGKEMFTKWDKYWSNGNTLLAMACVLDPRCKLAVVEYYYEQLYPNSSDMGQFVNNLKVCMHGLFKEYLDKASQDQASSHRQASTQQSRSTVVTNTRAGLQDHLRGKKSSEPAKTDIEAYLADPLDNASIDEAFHILGWWKVNAPKYPILAKMIRDILAIPISTVASEGTFSTSGRTLSSVRNSLNNESMEALICAQDWLKACITENGGQIGDPMWPSDEAEDVEN